jgi:acyl-CoA thioester hydrolase
MHSYHFTLPIDVRDYECDLQGIVNNAVYQNYLEHARHQFLKQHGLDFAKLSAEGVNLVVVRAEVDYTAPLRSGDAILVGLNVERVSPVKFAFAQDIWKMNGKAEQLVLASRFVCAAMNREGRPILPGVLKPLLDRMDAGAPRH